MCAKLDAMRKVVCLTIDVLVGGCAMLFLSTALYIEPTKVGRYLQYNIKY